MLADSSVFDQAEYDLYRGAVWPSIEAHGGTFMIRGGRFERLEGTHEWTRLIGLEFPGLAELRTWYGSPEYQALKAQRLRGARTDMVFLEETGKGGGVANPAAAAPDAAPPAYVIADIAIHKRILRVQQGAASQAQARGHQAFDTRCLHGRSPV